MAPLPVPVTATEQLLAAVRDEIAGLRADLAKGRDREEPSGDSGSIELREPGPTDRPAGVQSQPVTGSKRTRTRVRS
jgi:hypothetical protein